MSKESINEPVSQNVHGNSGGAAQVHSLGGNKCQQYRFSYCWNKLFSPIYSHIGGEFELQYHVNVCGYDVKKCEKLLNVSQGTWNN